MTSAASVIPLTQPVAQQLRRFGKYHLVQKLAEGGMAEIYLAKHIGAQGFERDVVVKCMLEHFSSSPDFVEMFLDEARVAARLFHPNLVQITDLGIEDGRYYLCMEYLPGEDLQRIIEKSRRAGVAVPIPIAARIALSACEGLDFAHRYQEGGRPLRLVHRDVSPSNVIVTYQGQVKVVDFGIAKASSKITHTQPGMVKGKLGYMSPEQARGEPLDPRSDVFSLGITFHELLTGRRVFEKDSEVSILMSLMSEPIPPASELRPDVPPEIDAIVMRAVAKDRGERYQSAAEMHDDLAAWLSHSGAAAGMSQIAAFMTGLFGAEHAARRTQIPTLKELAERGYVVAPEDLSQDSGEYDRTLVRPASGSSGAPTVAAPAVTETIPAPAATPGSPRRWGLIALAALGAAVVGAGGAAYSRLTLPTAAAPEAPPPVVESAPAPPPPAAIAEQIEPEVPAGEPAPAEAEKPTEAEKPAPPRLALLSMKDVYAAMGKRKAGIVGCGEAHRAQLPADGRVLVRLGIERTGSVGAEIVSSGVADTSLGRCLLGELGQLRFPKNRNEPALRVELPLRFNAR